MNAIKIDNHEDGRRRCFDIQGSLPKTETDHYRKNISIIVIASTAKRAIELTEEHNPGIAVWSLSHRGDYRFHQVIIDQNLNTTPENHE